MKTHVLRSTTGRKSNCLTNRPKTGRVSFCDRVLSKLKLNEPIWQLFFRLDWPQALTLSHTNTQTISFTLSLGVFVSHSDTRAE